MFYVFYSILTAPGVVIHELAHAVFCLFSGVKVHKIKLFSFGNPAGYVVHDEPQKFWQGLLISTGPLTINSLLAVLAFSQFQSPYINWRPLVALWLGIAVGLHAIPSSIDAKSLFQLANHRFWHNPFVIIAYPFILLLYILYLLKRLRVDFIFVAALLFLGSFYFKR